MEQETLNRNLNLNTFDVLCSLASKCGISAIHTEHICDDEFPYKEISISSHVLVSRDKKEQPVTSSMMISKHIWIACSIIYQRISSSVMQSRLNFELLTTLNDNKDTAILKCYNDNIVIMEMVQNTFNLTPNSVTIYSDYGKLLTGEFCCRVVLDKNTCRGGMKMVYSIILAYSYSETIMDGYLQTFAEDIIKVANQFNPVL